MKFVEERREKKCHPKIQEDSIMDVDKETKSCNKKTLNDENGHCPVCGWTKEQVKKQEEGDENEDKKESWKCWEEKKNGDFSFFLSLSVTVSLISLESWRRRFFCNLQRK